MAETALTFTAVEEGRPGPKWQKRWLWSWPAYEAWFISRGGDNGPGRAACKTALLQHMPELVPTYDALLGLAGGTDRAARFLSTWCPPAYLGGCSLAALSDRTQVRLVRNYDLSPDLNEGFLLRSNWKRPVMGMVEFLWGLSDGINDAGLTIALAYGGRSEVAQGFGITTILRYVLETCDTVRDAQRVLNRVPSHMAYNLVLADAAGATAAVEMFPGGGCRTLPKAIATNHQCDAPPPDRPVFTRTYERLSHLEQLDCAPDTLLDQFLSEPLLQQRYQEGFGTLFTAEYDPKRRSMRLVWPGQEWRQNLHAFSEGERLIQYGGTAPPSSKINWERAAEIDWGTVARDYMAGKGKPVAAYIAELCEQDAA